MQSAGRGLTGEKGLPKAQNLQAEEFVLRQKQVVT